MSALRLSRLALVLTVALFFTLVAESNISDYGSNWAFVQHVLSMDTTFKSPNLMWRAITNETVQTAIYVLIIAWQIMTALLLWIGAFRMLAARRTDAARFAKAKNPAILGLTAGFLLYALGFLVIAGEWFVMWQSKEWNAQNTSAIFVLFIGIALLHASGREAD
ncbi:MAG: DUF2165 family protein [Alphaproteobacteria bacterium]